MRGHPPWRPNRVGRRSRSPIPGRLGTVGRPRHGRAALRARHPCTTPVREGYPTASQPLALHLAQGYACERTISTLPSSLAVEWCELEVRADRSERHAKTLLRGRVFKTAGMMSLAGTGPVRARKRKRSQRKARYMSAIDLTTGTAHLRTGGARPYMSLTGRWCRP